MIFAQSPVVPDGTSPLFGWAALIGAVGVIILGLYQTYMNRRVQATVQATADEIQTAKSTAVDAKQTSTLAASATTAVMRQIEERGVHTGVVEDFRRTIADLSSQLIDISSSTSEQLSRSTEALVACERREAKAMAVQERMREEIQGLRTDVTSLQRIVAVQASGLVRPPDPT